MSVRPGIAEHHSVGRRRVRAIERVLKHARVGLRDADFFRRHELIDETREPAARQLQALLGDDVVGDDDDERAGVFEPRQKLDGAGDGLRGDLVFPPVAPRHVRRVIGGAIAPRRRAAGGIARCARRRSDAAREDLDVQELEDLRVPMVAGRRSRARASPGVAARTASSAVRVARA